MKILSFTPTDNLKEIEIDKSENILNSLSTIDNRSIKLIEEWKHDNVILECYGCNRCTQKDTLNTHNLPPCEISHTLYGDIYLVYKINNNIIDMDISQYGMLCYCIEERYENIEISDKIDENNSDEDIEENDKIIESSTIKSKKTKKTHSNSYEKILDELERDETNY